MRKTLEGQAKAKSMTIQISLLLPLAVLLGGCGSSDSTADVEKGVSQSVSQPKIETKDANDGNIIIEQIEFKLRSLKALMILASMIATIY